MSTFQENSIVIHESFDGTGFTDQSALVRASMDSPTNLTDIITYLFGNWKATADRFPLLFNTEGQAGGMYGIPIQDIQYEYPIIGKQKTSELVAISAYTSTEKPGYGRSLIYVVFQNRWFPPQATIRSTNGYSAQVVGEPVQVPQGWKYCLQHYTPDYDFYIPYTEFLAGTVWGRVGGSPVTQSRSTGNWQPHQNPGKRKNQISVLRESFRLGGNIKNKKVAEFMLNNKNGGATKLFLSWVEMQHYITMREKKEEHLWFSEYTRDAQGQNLHVDPNLNQIIPVGAGLKQQIPNHDTYTSLTEGRIKTILGDVFRGTTDTNMMDIVIYCGQGFREEFDNAIKDSRLFTLAIQSTGDKFIRSIGDNLQLGGYFTSYRHVDGHVVTLKALPLLDVGGYADISPRHPVSGRPMSSYEAFFIDHSRYDGIPNVQLIHEEGRAEIRGIHQGMTLVGDFMSYKGNNEDSLLNLATEKDESSLHMLCTCGVQMRRDTHSFALSMTVS